MTSIRTTLPLLAIALLLAACNTTTPPVVPQAPAPQTAAQPERKQNLRKGMTEPEIRSAWGEPLAVHKSPAGDTILVYRFDVRTDQHMVPTDMVEVPSFDPITGAAISVMEPTYSPQNITVIQTIVLQLKDGVLAAWARRLGEQRSFN